eukprot:UN14704
MQKLQRQINAAQRAVLEKKRALEKPSPNSNSSAPHTIVQKLKIRKLPVKNEKLVLKPPAKRP